MVSQEAHKAAQELRAEGCGRNNRQGYKRPDSAINKVLETGGVELEAFAVKVLSKAETLPFDMGSDSLNLELPTFWILERLP